MSRIENVSVDAIDHNPFRNTGKYPFVQRKIEALMRSIADVGLWEGVIARKKGNRYELAFGHHRVEAAQQSGLTEIPVIVRTLTNEQMLGFMGRENMEDYNADFLTLLETWEAAWLWVSSSRELKDDEPLEIAKLLGWTRQRHDDTGKVMISITASACHAARKLIDGGHVSREDLVDLTVSMAREICERAASNIARINKAGKALGTPRKHIAAGEKAIGKAVKSTADDARSGVVAQKDLRGQVDVNAYKHAQASKAAKTQVFEIFAKALADSIRKMLADDVAVKKLAEIAKALPTLTGKADVKAVAAVAYELGELADRASGRQQKLLAGARKLVPLSLAGVKAMAGGAS